MRWKIAAILMCVMLATGVCAAGTEKVLYSFTGGVDGGNPSYSGVVFDKAGNLYGTTSSGGLYGFGTVFELSPSGSGWTETVLHDFAWGSDGAEPDFGVILDEAGNLYGTTWRGGDNGGGTVFELSPSDSGWTFTTLYALGIFEDGDGPYGGLSLYNGSLYGVAVGAGHAGGKCGASGCGVAFVLTPSGSGWSYSVFHAFKGGTDGYEPTGIFSGEIASTNRGGSAGRGNLVDLFKGQFRGRQIAVFKPTGKLGYWPLNPVIADKAGNLYGTTSGGNSTVFKLTPVAGRYFYRRSVLHAFTEDEGRTETGVTMDAAGNLYGTAVGPVAGRVFMLTPAKKQKWTETVLYDFTGPDGSWPASNVVLDQAGNLYGTTNAGGAYGFGTVYEITP